MMKITIARFLFLTLLITTASLSAQRFHEIPNVDLEKLTNDWYQFEVGTITFDVEVQDEKIKQGTIVWEDGSSYMGTINHNTISGRGTYKWPNGVRYEGRILNNQKHGRGSFILQDNTKWYGIWKNDKRHGKGKIYDAEGNLIRKGVWENGREVK